MQPEMKAGIKFFGDGLIFFSNMYVPLLLIENSYACTNILRVIFLLFVEMKNIDVLYSKSSFIINNSILNEYFNSNDGS